MAEFELAPIAGESPCIGYRLNHEVDEGLSRSTGVVVSPHGKTHGLSTQDPEIEAEMQSATTVKAVSKVAYPGNPSGLLNHRIGQESLQSGGCETLPFATDHPRPDPPHVAIQPDEDEVRYPDGIKLAVVALALALALFLFGLDLTIVATAVPSITREFKTIADVGWYYSAYALTSCSFQFMFGKLYTLFSTKRVFISAVFIFEIGSLVSGVAPTSLALVLGRAISGFGASGIVAGVFTMITLTVPLRQRAAFSGFGAAIECSAFAIAPLVGGIVSDNLTWRWCFFINLPLGAVTLITVALFFQDPQRTLQLPMTLKQKLQKLDLISTLVFVPSITSLLIALQWGGTRFGWNDIRIIVLFCVSVTLIGIFAWLQRQKKEDALLPSRIIGQRSIYCGMLFVFCINTTLAIVQYYIPIYLQAVRSVSATQSGVLILPLIIGLIVSILISGSAVSIIGYYTPFAILTSVITPVATGLLTTLAVQESLARLISFQALFGFGVAIGFQAPLVAAQTVLKPLDAPIGIACIQFAQYLGPAIFISVAQTIFANRLRTDVAKYAPTVDVFALQNLGLSKLDRLISGQNLPGVLLGYDKAVSQVFYLPVALSCVGLFGSLGMEWRSVKKKRA